MLNRSQSALLCLFTLLLAGCGGRPDTRHIVRVEQATNTFYPRNAGCTFDGVPGAEASIGQMHRAKSISAQCYAPGAQADSEAGISRTFYTANPGCTIDGIAGTRADTEQILNAKHIAEACYVAPSGNP